MSDDNKVVQIRKSKPEETVAQHLLRIATGVEAMTGHKIDMGLVIMVRDDGRMEVHELGETSSELESIGILKVAEQVLLDEILG